MTRLLRWLGCADESILSQCPTERMRFTATGGTVLTVGALAGASATLTAHQFLHMSVAIAIAAGICWALAIMTLDRWLILSIRRQANPFGTLALALPRVAIAIVAGLVIAKPIVLITFKSEITARAAYDQREALLSAKQRIDDKYGPQISALTAQRNTLEQGLTTVNTSPAILDDPVYRHDASQAATLRAEAQTAESQALCELDGTCGTQHSGAGPAYAAKEGRVQQLQQQATTLQQIATARENSLLARQSAAAAQAHGYERAQLTQVLGRLQTLQSQRAHDEATLRHAYQQPIGLADRLDALGELSHLHPSIRDWSVLLTLLILLLDSAPAIGKALSSIGPPTLYEQIQHDEEQATHGSAQARQKARLKAANIAARELIDQANIHRDLWQAELRELLAQVVKVQREVTEHYIEKWAETTRDHVQTWINVAQAAQASADEDNLDPETRSPAGTSSNGAGSTSARARLRRLAFRGWRST